MALTNDDLTSITHRVFLPKMVDNIFNSNAGLQRARKKWYSSLDAGLKLVVPLAYATNSSAQRYSGGTLNVSSNSKKTSAEFEWKRYHAPIVIDGLDEMKNGGDKAVISHVRSEVQLAEKSVANLMGTDLFSDGTGTSDKGIIGFKQMVLNSGTYGIIARASNSWWNAQVDSTTTALTLSKAQALFGDCTVDNDKPSVIFTTQDIYDDFYALIQPQQRFGDEETIKAGFLNILWNGVPVIVDSHVSSGYMYMINERYVGIKYHKDRNFTLTPFQRPVNEDATYAAIFWGGMMYGNNCRMQGVFTTLA
jgi:hypothetical protein